jgi:lipopolysaccharide export system protein LptA
MSIDAEDTFKAFEFVDETVIFQGDVRVTNGPTTLLCERLTVIFQTNRTSKPEMSRPAAPGRSATAGPQTNPAVSTKVERIVAETNVVITQFANRATGDRAVYTASNDVVELTGRPVVMETVQGRLECRKIVLDRSQGKMTALSAPGPVRMQLRGDAFGQPGIGFLGTNALRLPGTRAPSTKAPPPTR